MGCLPGQVWGWRGAGGGCAAGQGRACLPDPAGGAPSSTGQFLLHYGAAAIHGNVQSTEGWLRSEHSCSVLQSCGGEAELKITMLNCTEEHCYRQSYHAGWRPHIPSNICLQASTWSGAGANTRPHSRHCTAEIHIYFSPSVCCIINTLLIG